LADKSVAGPAVEDERFSFIPQFIASTTDTDAGLITLDDWYRSELGDSVENHPEAILQMDIEGSEYAVLHSVSDSLLNRFRIIIVEFHKLHQLVDRYSFGWMSQAIYKILKTHKIVHIHPNNNKKVLAYGGLEIPATLEITFLHNDRVQRTKEVLTFPHALDRKCIVDKPELILPGCWF